MHLKETLSDLVSIESVSTKSNAEIIRYLEKRCRAAGFHVRRFPYFDDNKIEKTNLIAVAGSEWSNNMTVELALVGHTDTVPYDPSWADATNLQERNRKLYGRGACDTKGFIAAALTAAENVAAIQLARPLALIFTADEEVGLVGAKRLAQVEPLAIHHSIVGEPTSLQPIRAGKGYSLVEIVVRGSEAHSAYPAFGVSAITAAARLIVEIEAIAQDLQTDRNAAFDPPYTTINVGLIKGGSAKNVIPGECRFALEWRPIPNQSSAHVLNLIQEAIGKQKVAHSGLDFEVRPLRADSGFETAKEARVVRWLEEAAQKPAGTVAFGTEAAQMSALGSETVVFGPGDIRVAHQTGEFVPVEELEECERILSKALRDFCRSVSRT